MGRVLRPSDRAALVGIIDPDAYAADTYVTDWIDMSLWQRIMAMPVWGDLGENATIDAKLEQATDASGSGAKDISGKAITQLDASETPQPNNQQAVINLTSEEMDANNGFTHARLSLTVGTATSDAGGIVLGFDPRYGPASDNDLASVAEIVG